MTQIPLTQQPVADIRPGENLATEIASDLAYRRLAMVNVIFYGRPGGGDRSWVLIDAGIKGMLSRIRAAAAERFGEDARPSAIILTHGHFDHIGSVKKLAELWDAPVYAHVQEFPFLVGASSYPAPDALVGGGLMPILAPMFPRHPIDISAHLLQLPADGSVPGMPGWTWIHTPGHTPGHISLWRASDRALIAGDAFITTNQESAYAVATQKEEMHGPPTYFTPDWISARESVRTLAALEPALVVTGHGKAMEGPAIRRALKALADHFDTIAVPKKARPSLQNMNQDVADKDVDFPRSVQARSVQDDSRVGSRTPRQENL